MKIVLLTSMRTGSTWFANQLAEKHGLTNHNEYFHDYVPRTELFKRITNCIENDSWIVKLFPLHLQKKRGLDILNVLVSNNAELRFLFRKDLKQQVYSLACARFSHKYNKDRDKKKGIYGRASLTDVKELKEEGIETEMLPWIEDKEN